VAMMKDRARQGQGQGQGCGGRTKRRYNQGAVRNNGGKTKSCNYFKCSVSSSAAYMADKLNLAVQRQSHGVATSAKLVGHINSR
jgi:hypothetical protein